MSSTTAALAAANSRRRALSVLASALGVDLSPQPAAMRRADKAPVDTRLAQVEAQSASALTLSGPPSAVAWLNRATFGCTQSDLAAFNALGGNDAARWSAWLAQQLAPASISDAACDARVASANFQTLESHAKPALDDTPRRHGKLQPSHAADRRSRMRDDHPPDLQPAAVVRGHGRFLARPLQCVRLGLRRRPDVSGVRCAVPRHDTRQRRIRQFQLAADGASANRHR